MGYTLNSLGLFLIKTIFDFYIFLVLMRVLLRWTHTSIHNPLYLLVLKYTNPPLKKANRVFPRFHGIDVAAIFLLLALELAKLFLLVGLQLSSFPPLSSLGGLCIVAFAQLLDQLITIFFYAMILWALLSWFNPIGHGALAEILLRICHPLTRPVQRIIPVFRGFDFSPMIVIIILKLISIFLVHPLIQIGTLLSLKTLGA